MTKQELLSHVKGVKVKTKFGPGITTDYYHENQKIPVRLKKGSHFSSDNGLIKLIYESKGRHEIFFEIDDVEMVK